MIIVIAIVVAWIVILGPSLLRRRATQGDGIASITRFHRALRILERRSPDPIVSPAYRLRVEENGPESVPGGRPRLTVVGAKDLPRPALAFLAEAPTPPTGPLSGTSESLGHDRDLDHLRTLRRRRDTLTVLVALTVGTLLIGVLPVARPAWVITGVAGVALAAYLWLLVRMRRQAEVRGRMVHLPSRVDGVVDDDGIDDPEALARSWADHPVNQMAVGGG